jgi:hypothetical protein
VEQDWTPSTVTPSHLQNLVKHGFMAAAELEACHVPEDLTLCPLRHSMSGDSACHCTGSSARFYGITASSFTTSLPQESCI